MRIKKHLLIGALALSLGASALVFANPSSMGPQNNNRAGGHNQCHKAPGPQPIKMIPEEQRDAFKAFMKTSRQQILPMIKEKQALKLQLNGLLATPDVQWDSISKVVDKINTTDASINTLVAKNKLEIVQKFGVVLPTPPAPPMMPLL